MSTPEVDRRVSPNCVGGSHKHCDGVFWDEKFLIHNVCRCPHHEEKDMAHAPEKITLIVEQITSKEMEQRIAQAKADALIEFAEHLPEPWASLVFHRAGRVEVTLETLLHERADAIIREADR